MCVARIRSSTFTTKEKADRFEKISAKIGSKYLPMAKSNIGIRTDDFTCVCVTVYPDEDSAKAGLAGVAEWRDHNPEILESAEDNFFLEGIVTDFMRGTFKICILIYSLTFPFKNLGHCAC